MKILVLFLMLLSIGSAAGAKERKITSYRVVICGWIDATCLRDQVSDLIGDGFQPYGNLVVSESHSYQAMVKYEEDKNK